MKDAYYLGSVSGPLILEPPIVVTISINHNSNDNNDNNGNNSIVIVIVIIIPIMKNGSFGPWGKKR